MTQEKSLKTPVAVRRARNGKVLTANTDDFLPLQQLLGDLAGQAAQQMVARVNNDFLRA